MLEEYEEFTDLQLRTLEYYVSNTNSNIFALINLPEVIKGALFSRYSRSNLGLRSLLLKEFVFNEETSFDIIAGSHDNKTAINQVNAIKKAKNFYDRILDGYGDDSIGELGGAHLAIERISMLSAKTIEDSRIGGSPLEKSTRYVYFDQKFKGEYLFYKDPILMTSAFKETYLETCNMLFETYSKLIIPTTELIEKKFPKDANVSQAAYRAALRAKVLDCLRGLLPTSALTNIGLYGNGRFFESMIRKLYCHNLAELQDIGQKTFTELYKIIPSFIRRADPSHSSQKSFARFYETMSIELKLLSDHIADTEKTAEKPGVKLVSFDPDSVTKVAAALLFPYSKVSLCQLEEYCKRISEEEIARILDTVSDARENRRHKSPRALENAHFTFEVIADFGCYRDLQRHRMLTQDRQLLSCDYGYVVPKEIQNTPMGDKYCHVLDMAREVYKAIASELPEEGQYVVPMAYNIRWYFTINLRALQWICELRSAPAGHANYRLIAQKMAKMVCTTFPPFERFFKFVDYEGYELGRMEQEQRIIDRRT